MNLLDETDDKISDYQNKREFFTWFHTFPNVLVLHSIKIIRKVRVIFRHYIEPSTKELFDDIDNDN